MMGLRCVLLCAAALLGGVAHAQTTTASVEALPPLSNGPFNAETVAKGKAQYLRTCSQCHGFNMVNSGTTVYDLRKFPVDQADRFLNSVTNGKGNMPSFKGALEPEAIQLLWAYVSTRGGKEM